MTAASDRNYGFGPDPPGSPGIGTTADHFAFTLEVPAWTMELEPATGGQECGGLASHGHSGFILPAAEAARMREDVARQYLLGFYRQSGPPAAIAAEIRDMTTDAVVYRASWQQSSATARTLEVETNTALVPGGSYRLRVAFNKAMRIRDADGDVAPYAGQSPGVAVGSVTLEIPSLDGADVSLSAQAVWIDVAGGAPNGYLRYTDDAFAVDFTLPSTLDVSEAAPAVLLLDVRDLAQMALDGDPSSAVDWSNGAWLRYDNATGVDGDVGEADCSFKPFVAADANAEPPAIEAECSAAPAPPTPPPPPPSPTGGGGGGGGDATTLLMLLGLAALARRRRRWRWQA
jgi:MYXO-CTERM domain-containing protein